MKLAILSCLVSVILFCFAGAAAQSSARMTPPGIISVPMPDYPQAAKAAGIGGEVIVIVLVDKKGKSTVKDAFGPSAPCSNLEDPLTATIQNGAMEAAKKASFVPASWKGKPAEMGISLIYKFDPAEAQPTASAGETMTNFIPGRIINVRAITIPKPKYPGKAKGIIGGTVEVRVIIFEDGLVHFAAAVSGHRALRRAAVEAACQATFVPTSFSGKPIKTTGILSYIFYNTYR